ncbi:MAG: hypothetical protein V4686_02820 [Patescibacteria group bacterium]
MKTLRFLAVVLTAIALLSFFSNTSEASGLVDVNYATLNIVTASDSTEQQTGLGKTVFVPIETFLVDTARVKISFELYRSDSVQTYNMDRLNILNFNPTCRVVQNNDPDQWISSISGFVNFATAGAMYTDLSTSPEVNQGMFICPLDSSGHIVASLVGTRINDPNPHLMNSGAYKVHSNASMTVHKVKVVNMPLIFRDGVGAQIMRDLKTSYPNRPLSLLLDVNIIVNLALNPYEGCMYSPSLRRTSSLCWLHFDGRLIPEGDFQLAITSPNSVIVPAGCFSWLDLYHSPSPGEIGTKVNLHSCNIMSYGPQTISPPTMGTNMVSGIQTPHAKGFYTLRTRIE